MSKERQAAYAEVKKLRKEGKISKLEAYELFNIITGVASIAIIGGFIGFALAAIDFGQVAVIEWYKRKKRKK